MDLYAHVRTIMREMLRYTFRLIESHFLIESRFRRCDGEVNVWILIALLTIGKNTQLENLTGTKCGTTTS